MKNTVMPHQCFLHHWPNRLQRWPRVRGAFGVWELLLDLRFGSWPSSCMADKRTIVVGVQVLGSAVVSTSVSGWSFCMFDLRGESSMV
jgi:hypothetical protein